jgi:hypothetical protein
VPTSSVSYRLPFAAGQSSKVVQGWNTRYSHNGRSAFAYDFKMPVGTPVLSAAAGRVSYVHKGETACGGPAYRDRANVVTIDHADGTATQYGHLSRVDVKVGDVVAAGEQIALSGRTGYTGCVAHLHFARQAQGGEVTQSRPIYFEDYPGVQFLEGMVVEAAPPACAPLEGAIFSETFCGTYFYGTSMRMASMETTEDAINVHWKLGRPADLNVDTHRSGSPSLTARWAGTFTFPTDGPYAFDLTASGGVRLSIDGEVVFDSWDTPARLSDLVLSRSLTAGAHQIGLEFHQSTGAAVVHLGWWASDPADGASIR